ncbi:MAG: helix-turn-helix domain-containing protein [Proteobacteria bacterium]|jgi:excisionase family DNA binding protein|nr:helix-turn-helix domain-containing protein [Pseudomonadota bacterium]
MRDDLDSYLIKALARALEPAVSEAVKQSVARAIDPTIVNLIQYTVGKELEGSLRVNLERTLKDLTNEAAKRTSMTDGPATQPLPSDRFLTVKEAAQYLSIGKSTLWRRVKSGELPLYKVGQRARRFRLEDVESLVRRL